MARSPGILRLCSVFEADAALLARPDAASFDVIGGMQNHTAELTRCLDTLGVAQLVVTSRLGGPAGRTLLGRRAVVRRTGLAVRPLRQLWALLAVPAVLRARDLRLVHAHQGEDVATLLLAMLAARWHRVPLVVTLHLSVRHTLRAHGRRAALLRRIGGRVERRAVSRAAAVLVLTAATRDLLVADGVSPSQVSVIPSGFAPDLFDTPHADPLPGLSSPRVLFVGRLAPQKLPLDLVAAFERTTSGGHLVVVGDGPLRAEVQARAAASPARDRITLVGLVPHEQVPGHLAHADVFVMPSAYEELGSVLVEAMASGVPVVANRVDGIPTLIEDGVHGLLVDSGDVDALAGAIDRVLGNPVLAAALAAAAHERVRAGYSWPALAARVGAVYERVAPSTTVLPAPAAEQLPPDGIVLPDRALSPPPDDGTGQRPDAASWVS